MLEEITAARTRHVPMSERKQPPIEGNIVTYFPGTYGSGVPTGIGGSFRSEA